MPAQHSAAPIAADAGADFQATQALISEIAAEARASGETLVFDPEAPPDSPGGDSRGGDTPASNGNGKAKGKPLAKPAAKPTEGKNDETDHDQDHSQDRSEDRPEDGAEQEGDAPGEQAEQGDAEDGAQAVGEIDAAAVKAALDAEGGVDMLALAKALGKELEQLGLTPGASKFLRLEKRKSDATLKRANDIAQRLKRDYGEQIAARKAVEQGKLEPAIEYIQNTFGMDWNELNKAVGALLQGKPVPGLEDKRKLRELQAKEALREAEAKKQADATAAQGKVTQAKTWIAGQLKGDKLASPEFEKQLLEAGFPSVVDLVFDEMQANYSKGLTDPKKALEKVKLKLEKQAKALQRVGLAPKGVAPKSAPVSASKPRAGAQTGAAGNGREMTDTELRQAVLKEAGLFR